MVVGLFLAVAMNRKIRGINIYRTAAYATMAISTISEAIVFITASGPSPAALPPQEAPNLPPPAGLPLTAPAAPTGSPGLVAGRLRTTFAPRIGKPEPAHMPG